MSQCKETNSSILQVANNRSSLIQWDIQLNIKKFFNSWFKTSEDKPYTQLNTEKVSISHPGFPNEKNKKKTDLKYNSRKSKREPRLLYIDLNKLEDLNFNTYEKKKLRCVLNNIKYVNNKSIPKKKETTHERRNTAAVKKTFSGEKKTNTSVLVKQVKKTFPKEKKVSNASIMKKVKKSFSKENKNSKESQIKLKLSGNILTNEISLNRARACMECKKYKSKQKIIKENKKAIQRKQRNPNTTITSVSEEVLLNTLINIDHRACGDIGAGSTNGHKQSSDAISALLNEKRSIRIKNIELKYLNPTYVVQYNGEQKTDPVEDVRVDRFSSAALEAHLGHLRSLNVTKTRASQGSGKVTFHYEGSEKHVIGTGHTEDLLKEERRSKALSKGLARDTESRDSLLTNNFVGSHKQSLGYPLEEQPPDKELQLFEKQADPPQRGGWQHPIKRGRSYEEELSIEDIPPNREWKPYRREGPSGIRHLKADPNREVDHGQDHSPVKMKNPKPLEKKEGTCKVVKRLIIGCLGLSPDEKKIVSKKQKTNFPVISARKKQLMELKRRGQSPEKVDAHCTRTTQEEFFKSMEN